MTQILSGKIEDLLADFIEVRKNTLNLFKPLKIEDAVVQSNVFGSPPNWHLAHVTWFFQKMLRKNTEKRSAPTKMSTWNISTHTINNSGRYYLNPKEVNFPDQL